MKIHKCSKTRAALLGTLALSLPFAINAAGLVPVEGGAAINVDTVLNKGETIVMSGEQSSQTFYTFDTPADVEAVSFVMNGGTGDADLIVKFGSRPSLSTYDCRLLPSGNDEQCHFSAGQVGTYYVMIYGYDAYDGVSLVADHTTMPPPVGDSGSETGIDIARRDWVDYSVDVPADTQTLSVVISGGTGDADLYLSYGDLPTQRNYDCRPYLSGNEEFCIVDAPSEGTWNIGIRGYSAVTDLTMSWSYQ